MGVRLDPAAARLTLPRCFVSSRSSSKYWCLSGFDKEAEPVETLAMDMCLAYINAVEKLIPGPEDRICFDKLHMAQHLGNAVDKELHLCLTRNGDRTWKGSRHFWLTNLENLTSRFRESETLRRVAEKTGRAWALKETAVADWRHRSQHCGREPLGSWHNWAIRSRLEPLREVDNMIQRRLEGLVNAISTGLPYPVGQVHHPRLPQSRAIPPSRLPSLRGAQHGPGVSRAHRFHTT